MLADNHDSNQSYFTDRKPKQKHVHCIYKGCDYALSSI